MQRAYKIIFSLLLLVSLILMACYFYYRHKHAVPNSGHLIAMTALSSDGHYAFTTDDKNYAILWDLNLLIYSTLHPNQSPSIPLNSHR